MYYLIIFFEVLILPALYVLLLLAYNKSKSYKKSKGSSNLPLIYAKHIQAK